MDVLISKIIALSLLALLTLLFGLAPVKLYSLLRGGDGHSPHALRRRKLGDLVVSCLLHFAGGVLVSTSFLHMIPEVRENLHAAAAQGAIPVSNYPLPELVVCVGFFFIYTVELVVHSCVRSHTEKTVTEHRNCEEKLPNDHAETKLFENSNSNSINPVVSNSALEDGNAKVDIGTKVDVPKECKDIKLAVFRGSLIVAALSFHSVFEGMAVGLQPKSADVWTLFAAICIHKVVIAFCVGIELTAIGTKFKVLLMQVVVLAFVSPLGTGIGIVVMESTAGEAATNALVIGIFQGLAAGTLIYVTFFEVLLKDEDRESYAFLKLLCCVSGFSVIAAVHVLE